MIAGLGDVIDDEDADLVGHLALVCVVRCGSGSRTTTGAGPGAVHRARRARLGSGRPRIGRPGLLRVGGGHGLDDFRRQDAVGVDEGLEDDAGRLGRDSGSTGWPVTGSMKSSADRRIRLTDASSWANLMTSACCGVTDRMTICCWPLSAVAGWAGAAGGAAATFRRVRGGAAVSEAAGGGCRGPACPAGGA